MVGGKHHFTIFDSCHFGFPFDEQMCLLKVRKNTILFIYKSFPQFGSWSHSRKDLDLCIHGWTKESVGLHSIGKYKKYFG